VSSTVLDMSMSLDGFITGPDAGPGNGLGDGGERLHEWFFDDPAGADRRVVDELMSTGAIVAGRGTFVPAGGWGGDHHDGVPIFVIARDELGIDVSDWPLVTVVPDVAGAMTAAKRAAGGRDVLVHGGATIARLAIEAGVLDEIEIHVVPVLLGAGRRLFDGLGPVELERTRVLEGRGATHLRYRVAR
jgi:dihydrofolate reductase